ncbi:MAG: TonB-dependent siderophore receptor [Aquimonas sp.]|nr:TonB-dependent siderophore receptor [Aquimonas sp.]
MNRTPDFRAASPRRRPLALALGLALSMGAGAALAAEQDDAVAMPRIDVVGKAENQASLIPGAVEVITAAQIDQIQPRSTEDVLRRVPGIFIKREEESAVVTNIGVRGLTAGDYKTLVLEDGVPIQPGLFVGNSRYYNPRIQRMEGVEVLKGAASLRYGPNTIGGVINFLTRTPEDGAVVSARIGSWDTVEATAELGASTRGGDASFGLIATRAESDGFMDKGYGMTDLMLKSGLTIGDHQSIGFKLAHYKNDANISYRGIFPDAYAAGARFNPAPDDFFLTGRTSFDLNHDWELSASARLKTLFYASEMYRDYWRFATVSGAATTSSPEGYTVWNYGNNLNGNNREFTRLGLETRLSLDHAAFGIGNEAEFGLRLMQEDMKDVTVLAVRGRPRTPDLGRGGISQDRLDSGDSLALFAQNRFDISEQLSVTAGLRVESFEQTRKNRRSTAPADSFSNTEVMPGLGATWVINPSVQVFGSVYRAFAPPLVGSVLGAGDTPTEAEKSLNLEFGLRGDHGAFSYSATAFQMDFSNQVDPGVSGIRAPNQGDALHRGLEGALGYAIGSSLRLEGNFTWIPTAEYREDRPGEALKGNRIAYAPERMANLSLAYQAGPLQAALLFNYVSEQFGDGLNRREFTTASTGTWGGLMPSYSTTDLTASYALSENLSLSGAIKNLTDKDYIAGLRQGLYIGPERSFEFGVRYRF